MVPEHNNKILQGAKQGDEKNGLEKGGCGPLA